MEQTLRIREAAPVSRISPARTILLGFAAVILAGAFLLTLPGASVSGESAGFLTALFTATSAVCVTGLVVVDTATQWSAWGQVIILGLIQTGGLGFMTLASLVFLLLGKRVGLKERILIRESLNQYEVAGIVRLVKRVLIFSFLVEGFFACVLAWRWSLDFGWRRGLWLGVFHSISAFNNAGFDLFGDFRSLTGYVGDPVVVFSITTLIVLGGIGFSVAVNVWEWRERRLTVHSRLALLVTAYLLAGGTLAVLLFEWNNTLAALSVPDRFLGAYFQSVTPRTAGFNTLDIAKLRHSTQFLLTVLMFIGASPGSTGGGIKTTTFGLLAAAVWSQSRGKEDTEVLGRRIPEEQVSKALAVTLMSGCLVTVVTLLLTLTDSADFLTLLFETVSAFGTVGLSMGVTPTLTSLGRILIIITMFAGRVGPLTAMIALAQSARPKNLIRRVEDRVLIG